MGPDGPADYYWVCWGCCCCGAAMRPWEGTPGQRLQFIATGAGVVQRAVCVCTTSALCGFPAHARFHRAAGSRWFIGVVGVLLIASITVVRITAEEAQDSKGASESATVTYGGALLLCCRFGVWRRRERQMVSQALLFVPEVLL